MTTMPIDASILSEIDHLRDLGDNERSALSEEMELVRYSSGQVVFSYGDPGHALYIVRSGEVEIYIKNDKGEKIVLEVSKSGEIFGEISLLDDGPRTAWVAALGRTRVDHLGARVLYGRSRSCRGRRSCRLSPRHAGRERPQCRFRP